MQPSKELTAARDEFVKQLNAAMEKRQPPAPLPENESSSPDPVVRLSRLERAVMNYQANLALYAEVRAFFDNKRLEIQDAKFELRAIAARYAEMDTEIQQSESLLNSFKDKELEKAQSKLVKAAKAEREKIQAAEVSQVQKIEKLEREYSQIPFKGVHASGLPRLLSRSNFVQAVFLEREESFKLAIDTEPVKDYLLAVLAYESTQLVHGNYYYAKQIDYKQLCATVGDLVFTSLFDLPNNDSHQKQITLKQLTDTGGDKIGNMLDSEVSKLESEPEFKKAA